MPSTFSGDPGRVLRPPALPIARKRNLQLMPRTLWLFWAGLAFPGTGMLVLILFLPTSVLITPVWVAAALAAVLALLFLRTKTGYFVLGPTAAIIIGTVTLRAAGRIWLG